MQITTQQKRTLSYLVTGDEWQPRATIQHQLGAVNAALDEVIGLGLVEQRAVRRGTRGRLRREVRITRDGLIRWAALTLPADERTR